MVLCHQLTKTKQFVWSINDSMKKCLLSGLAVLGLMVAGISASGCSPKSSGVTQPAGGPKPITSPATAGSGDTTGGGNAAAANPNESATIID
jgi:hypothetical protein